MAKTPYWTINTAREQIQRTGLDTNQHAGPLLGIGTSLGLTFDPTDTGDRIVQKIVKNYPEFTETFATCRRWQMVSPKHGVFKHLPIE